VIGAVALVVFVLSCSAVGLRLLWIGQRDGFGPALSCGNGFLFIALIGQPLSVASGLATSTVGELNHGMAAASMLFMAAGLSSFYSFTLTVFRLRSPWAWALTVGAILVLGVCSFGRIDALATADRALLASRVGMEWMITLSVVSTVCYAWLAAEALLEWSKARKRLALGLADPAVSNRFLMWGIFGASTTLLSAFMLWLNVTTAEGSQGLVGQVALTGFGLVSAATVMLAFCPPAAYVAWVRGRAARAAAA
jgi:hypothetical protein